ncbi:hypothetical protein CEXT_637791 [Caerostris extrusa]|uniref:Uncharacterized protein n=1 Tax=Caerostris extrusa TaxID=172846 RepID=A0AAV4UJC3_CAEEX|nr:hypothetical protein CEXT_637791 [Caerostris extrusa]
MSCEYFTGELYRLHVMRRRREHLKVPLEKKENHRKVGFNMIIFCHDGMFCITTTVEGKGTNLKGNANKVNKKRMNGAISRNCRASMLHANVIVPSPHGSFPWLCGGGGGRIY